MIWSILSIALLVYVGLVLLGCAVQDAMIFPRSIANSSPMSLPPDDVEVLQVQTDPGVIVEGWLLPAPDRSPDAPGPAVVFFHGNAERIDNCIDHAREYQRRGYTVLLPEYRGYGNSDGKPSQQGIVKDMVAFHALLAARPEVDPAAIVYHGRSLGGAIAAQLAVEAPPRALVLESTFTSITSFAARYLMPPFVVRHPFRTDHAVKKTDCPILLVHGRDDHIVPVSHSRALARLAPDATLAELAGGHNDFPHDWVVYWDHIDRFLTRAGAK